MLTSKNMKPIAMVVPYATGYEVIYKEHTFDKWRAADLHSNKDDAIAQKNRIINQNTL